jgi:glucokinase
MKKGLRLGVDLGGTSVKMALVDERGGIVDSTFVETSGKPAELARALKEASVLLVKGRRVLGTGVGVAGDTDTENGVGGFAPTWEWQRVPL